MVFCDRQWRGHLRGRTQSRLVFEENGQQLLTCNIAVELFVSTEDNAIMVENVTAEPACEDSTVIAIRLDGSLGKKKR